MQQFTRGGNTSMLRGTAVLLYRVTFLVACANRRVPYNLFCTRVWRDSGYIYAGTIRTWIRTPDMMRDVLDMVNFVVDSHSMSDALDTYDTSFRGRSSYSIASSSGNKLHDPPYRIPDTKYPRIDKHIVAGRLGVRACDLKTFCEGIRANGPAIE